MGKHGIQKANLVLRVKTLRPAFFTLVLGVPMSYFLEIYFGSVSNGF